MDKNTCNKGLEYKTKGWLQGWSLKTTCGYVWYIHHSYNVYLIWKECTPISLTRIYKGNQGVFQVCNSNRALYRRYGESHGGRR
jgi:hypothetical protein